MGLHYLYAPEAEPRGQGDAFLREATAIAREQKSIFLKVEPLARFSVSGYRARESRWLQPRKTFIIDLTKTGEELMRAMQEKTRYNVRLAQRRGVLVRGAGADPPTDSIGGGTGEFQKFWDLLEETAQRDRFHLHDKSHYEKLLEIRSPHFSNELFFAEYQGRVVASAMVNFYVPDRTATYLHGASSGAHRDVMAPYLLHWRIIEEAKRRGLERYNFGGADPEKWPGPTRFKKGFGGTFAEYPRAVDIVYRPMWYWTYELVRKLF